MQYYNKDEPNDVRTHGLSSTLVAYLVIMVAIMFIFSFAIFVYAQKKRNCREHGLSSRTLEDVDERQVTVYESDQVTPTPKPGYVATASRRTTESGVLDTFANLAQW
nr:uncharacterized protein LOC129386136 [Dermacentor andersoni]